MRGRRERGLSNVAIGAIALLALIVVGYLAFTKNVPWGGGTEFEVAFADAQNLRPDTQVRIAGVNVGEVTAVEPLAGADTDNGAASGEATEGGRMTAGGEPVGGLVTIELDDEGLPLKEDATFKLRPRLFLEGNLFVDVRPGSPSAPAVPEGYTFPPQQTSNSVQLDQILTGVFPTAVRRELQSFLDQLGGALGEHGGAEGLREVSRSSGGAFRYGAQVNEALLGERPHDLSSLIGNLNRVFRGLDRDEPALRSLITNLSVMTGSFAAQDAELKRAVGELPGTLSAGRRAFASLNAAFPPTRAFAREILPGVRTAPATLDAAIPWLEQVRGLARPAELRGLSADLRVATPRLARLTRRTIPFLGQARALSSCFNHTILPWANDRVDGGPAYNSTHGPQGTVYEETGYGLAGIAGESRSGDANGQYIRVIGGGGLNTVTIPNLTTGEQTAGVTPLPLQGAMPTLDASRKTRFRPGAPCENQDPPDLRAVPGPAPRQQTIAAGAAPSSGPAAEIGEDAAAAVRGFGSAARAAERGSRGEALRRERRAMRALRGFYRGNG